ncbi:MAG: FAD-dependent oxidoreductase [Phormidesmis sp.]
METSSADILVADILVVGGGAGATAAALQAARRNANLRVILVSELPWLGGMLTSAGVSAPDGNELAAFQTGIWGAFLKALRQRHPGGLDNGWVSFFTYSPAVGAQIFADWVAALPNLQWISGQRARAVLRSPVNAIIGVQFDTVTVNAKITLDGTELGDLLALGEVPHRWGWETQSAWQEPSAPVSLTDPADPLYAITQRYPVQSPTWVVVMQDYGTQNGTETAPIIQAPPVCTPDSEFEGAWANCGDGEASSTTASGEVCLNYGRLPNGQLMINWPHHGNDYGVGLQRLIESDQARVEYGQAAQWHSQSFARYIQRRLGRRYGLAQALFPSSKHSPGGAFALMPYYRESRRVIGLQTVSEPDILPMAGMQVAALPMNKQGEMSAIAYGNYPNDHHYPGYEMPLAPKFIRWGGRMTGTPFTIPYEALVPKAVDGLLMCEKNISVSHIANGATRLQPVVLGVGQAAGMAAALCLENGYQPRELSEKKAVHTLQQALLSDPAAPAALIPLFDLSPEHPQWYAVQNHYLSHPETYPSSGYYAATKMRFSTDLFIQPPTQNVISVKGCFFSNGEGQYEITQKTDDKLPKTILLVTVRSEITELFVKILNGQRVDILGVWNSAGKWLLCERIELL